MNPKHEELLSIMAMLGARIGGYPAMHYLDPDNQFVPRVIDLLNAAEFAVSREESDGLTWHVADSDDQVIAWIPTTNAKRGTSEIKPGSMIVWLDSDLTQAFEGFLYES